MRAAKQQHGVAAVELAIVLTLLVAILFGITELGRAIYEYNTLVKATRDAARYLTTQSAGTHLEEATCLAISGSYSYNYKAGGISCGTPLLPNLKADMVTVSFSTGVSTCPVGSTTGCGSINLVAVCINAISDPNCPANSTQIAIEKYTFYPVVVQMFPWLRNIVFGTIKTVMRQGAG